MTRKIRFMETVLRDGQQSQIATRMARTCSATATTPTTWSRPW